MELFDLMKRLGNFGIETEFLFCMLLVYVNMFIYGWDFYKLVKKKSAVETLAIILCPAIFICTGIIMLTIMVNIPFSEKLDQLLPFFDSERLWKEILMLACLFWFIFAVAYQMWRSRRVTKKETVKWLLSYTLDFISSAVLLGVGIYFLATKKNPFRQSLLMSQEAGVNLLFFLFLNAVIMLLVKTVLIALSIAVRLYTGEITIFHYHEGKNPVAYLVRYILFYQNAVVRGMIPALVLYGWILGLLADEMGSTAGDTAQEMTMFLALCVMILFLVVMALGRILMPLGRLKKWGNGDRRKMAEQFCQEYFLGEAIWSNDDYVITRSFLVDRGRPLQIYLWENLKGQQEVVRGRKTFQELRFSDGSVCLLSPDSENEPICNYAEDYCTAHGIKDAAAPQGLFGVKEEGMGPTTEWQQQTPAQKWAVWFMIIIFLLLYLMNMFRR